MASIRASLVRWLFRVIRADSGYSSVDAARRTMKRCAAIEERVYRPRLVKSRVTRRECGGFPVYWLDSGDNATGPRAILYLHGGAFVNQPTIAHWRYADKMARATGLPLAVAIYPKAPAHQYGEAYGYLADVYTSMREMGYAEIIIMGDSAGATLTLGFAMWLGEQGLPMPIGLVPLSPCVDLAMANPDIPEAKMRDPMLATPGLGEIVRVWSGGADLRDYRLSPLYGNVASLPPTLIIIGSDEILRPDARLFADRARLAGAPLTYLEFPSMMHDFPLMPIAEAKRTNREIRDFILNSGAPWERSQGAEQD